LFTKKGAEMTLKITRTIILSLAISTSFLAQAQSTFEEGYQAASTGDYQQAFKIWQPLATQDNALAQSNLGILYENGWGVKQDAEKAFFWYQKSAELGQMDAQHNLATLYQQGNGVEQDLNKAGFWYEKAAKKGHGDSQVILGVMYQEIEEYQQAAYWFNKAMKLNVEGAQKNLDYLCQLKPKEIASYCK